MNEGDTEGVFAGGRRIGRYDLLGDGSLRGRARPGSWPAALHLELAQLPGDSNAQRLPAAAGVTSKPAI
jgi:hypothetical protein